MNELGLVISFLYNNLLSWKLPLGGGTGQKYRDEGVWIEICLLSQVYVRMAF